MAYENIIYEKEENLAVITFNRPEAMNALNNQTRAEFRQAIDEVASDDAQHRPGCSREGVEDVLLPKKGKLANYTIQYYPCPAPFKTEKKITPYGIGLVFLGRR